MGEKILFTPMKIGECEIKNRVVMPPMHMGLTNMDGTLSEKFIKYYEERAKGGTGLIITEITRVNDAHGATSFMQPGLSHDYQIPSWKKLVRRIHKHGAKVFVQLHHPGRQNHGIMVNTVPLSLATTKVWKSFPDTLFKIAPTTGRKLDAKQLVCSSVSASKCEESDHAHSKVRPLSKREVKKLIQEFIDAAVRAKKAGLDGIELHAAHGYLIQQFLSPNTNKRTDEYGGSFENRMRFLKEIIEGIRKACGNDYPLIVRLSVDEFYEKIGQAGKGYTLETGVKYAKALEKMEIDAIDVSSAAYDTYNYWLEPTSFDCGWRAYLAEAVKKEVSIPVIAANLIRSEEQAEQQLQDGVQDFIALGRPHIADAHWVEKVESGRGDEVKRCINCLNCMETMYNGAFAGTSGYCAVNPTVGKEAVYYNLPKDGKGRKVVVIGAGVAGLTAAELLAKRGFKVIVLEKEGIPGGQINLANKPPKKEKIGWAALDMATNAQKAGAQIEYNTLADIEKIKSYEPYAVVLATGAVAVKPGFVKGNDKPNVYTTTEILNGTVDLSNQKVAVVGSGMTGLETAELLTEKGAKITIIEMADKIAPIAWHQLVEDVVPKLKKHNTKFITSAKLLEVTDSGVKIEHIGFNKLEDLKCDSVVLSLGSKSVNALLADLKSNFSKVYAVGDAERVGNIARATSSAFDIAVNQVG
ncbi:NAD(P)/FAD-dependent oxidoreductase [Eubacteriaceae bacterium ES3]|nr:NAD(P)/FAD-dependent oxidoreductase [Eubacteriaceae bacterium ES3]